VAQTIIAQAREVWLAADASKFNRPAMIQLGHAWRTSTGCSPTRRTARPLPRICSISAQVRCEIASDHPRPRPGDDQFARHRVRPRRPGGGRRAARVPADLSAARLGGARRAEIWATQHAVALEAIAQGRRCRHRRHRRHRHHQPARDHRAVGPRHRAAGAPCHRLAGPAHRRPLRQLRAQGMPHRVQQKTGLVIDAYFSGTKLRMAAGQRARRARAGRGRRAGLRHHRQLAGLEPHRRPRARHRREQRLAHHAVQPAHATRGTPTAEAAAHPGARCCRIVRRPAAHWPITEPCCSARLPIAASPATSRRRPSARPASVPRHGQEHLRHRLLHADEHRCPARAEPQRLLTTAGWQVRRRAAPGVLPGRQRVRRRRHRAVAARRPAGHQGQCRGAVPGRERARRQAA
jgi:hypothetical protein